MKKIIFIFTLMLSALTISAQKAIETTKLTDNVYVGAGIGVHTPFDLFPVNTSASLKVGKDITPILGVFMEGTFGFGDNFGKGVCTSNLFVKTINVGINNTINLHNLFYGYKNRVFELNTVTGLGWRHILSNGMSHADDLSAKTGLIANINFNPAWQMYVEPAILWTLPNAQFNSKNAQVGINVGMIYKFKNSNGSRGFKVYDISLINDAINSFRTHKCAVRPDTIVKEYETTIKVQNTYIVEFAQGEYELTPRAVYELDLIPTNSIVNIEASASPEGDVDYNISLSEHRAAAVADYLVKRGVKVNKVEGVGVRDNQSNRTAVITVL